PLNTIATAATLFHRFFARESFTEVQYDKIAAACLFVACKSEESSRRAVDLAKAWLYVSQKSTNDQAVDRFVQDLLVNEMRVFETTCFDLQINHPYIYLIQFADEIGAPQKVITAAVAFANDSLRLPLCLWYQPKAIAAACILMAYHGCKLQFPIELSTDWGKYLVSNANILLDVVNAIMEVYRLPRKGVISPTEELSPPQNIQKNDSWLF
ncbi:hypothetical protein K501DRAFT_285520, partial [Backusella circina FSU 941]